MLRRFHRSDHVHAVRTGKPGLAVLLRRHGAQGGQVVLQSFHDRIDVGTVLIDRSGLLHDLLMQRRDDGAVNIQTRGLLLFLPLLSIPELSDVRVHHLGMALRLLLQVVERPFHQRKGFRVQRSASGVSAGTNAGHVQPFVVEEFGSAVGAGSVSRSGIDAAAAEVATLVHGCEVEGHARRSVIDTASGAIRGVLHFLDLL